jgi:translation initiation factor eIF-2B subunit delta
MPSSDPPPAAEAPKAEATQASQSQKEKKAPAGKQAKEPATPTDQPKLSGAELKKRAKEEKAARRAQALADKQTGGAAPSPATASGPAQKSQPQKGQQGGQKRRGSAAGETRNMPVKGGQKIVPVMEAPKEEDKTVEFFRHLYKTRTTSIAGAGKEVHPAVLALGLQMSNYTICGSCARLVATLQAFKRVSCTFGFHFFVVVYLL